MHSAVSKEFFRILLETHHPGTKASIETLLSSDAKTSSNFSIATRRPEITCCHRTCVEPVCYGVPIESINLYATESSTDQISRRRSAVGNLLSLISVTPFLSNSSRCHCEYRSQASNSKITLAKTTVNDRHGTDANCFGN